MSIWSTGGSTTLGGTPSNGQVFNWAFGGVLEAYYVNSCDDYPSDRQHTFEQVTVFNQNLHPLALRSGRTVSILRIRHNAAMV